MQSASLVPICLLTILAGQQVSGIPTPQFGSHLGECNVTCSYPNMQLVCSWPTLYCAMPGNFIVVPAGTCDQCSAFDPVEVPTTSVSTYFTDILLFHAGSENDPDIQNLGAWLLIWRFLQNAIDGSLQ